MPTQSETKKEFAPMRGKGWIKIFVPFFKFNFGITKCNNKRKKY